MSDVNKIESGEKRSLEWKSFLFIAVVLFPILSVAFVGGYGFIVWALQVFFFGPPVHTACKPVSSQPHFRKDFKRANNEIINH